MAFIATDFIICAIELRMRLASYDKGRLIFWLVPSDFNCFCFIGSSGDFSMM